MDGKTLTNASAIDRSKTDFYATPGEVTEALVRYFKLCNLHILEPACGQGHMSKVLAKTNIVSSYDFYDDSYGRGGEDFLKRKICNTDWIITNPPFKMAEEFIRHAWSFNCKFAFLLKSQYWHASSRTSLFHDCRPSHILALNWRPDFHFGTKGGSPTMECLWAVWNRENTKTEYDILKKHVRQ